MMTMCRKEFWCAEYPEEEGYFSYICTLEQGHKGKHQASIFGGEVIRVEG